MSRYYIWRNQNMKKYIALILTLTLLVSLSGCVGTTVVIGECTCPAGSHTTPEPIVPAEGALKTGLSVSVNIADSTSATADAEGAAKYDVTLAAVTVDDNGVIVSCVIDSIPATVNFDATGAITSDVTANVLTKNELGEGYGMKLYAGSTYEWNEQAASFAEYVTGKTAAEVSGIAVNEKTAPTDADLASTVTIAVGGFMNLIEKAAE